MIENRSRLSSFLKLAIFVSRGDITPLYNGDCGFTFEFTDQSSARNFIANLFNILNIAVGEKICKINLKNTSVIILSTFSEYELGQLDQALKMADFLAILLLISRSGDEVSLIDAAAIPNFSFIRRGGKLFLESDAEEKDNVSYIGSTSDRIVDNLQNTAFNARFEVSTESLSQLQDMICFLAGSGKVVTAFAEKNFLKLYSRYRNLAALSRALWRCSNISYFSSGDTKIYYQDNQGQAENTPGLISVQVSDPSHALLISNFLLNNLMLDVPDSARRTKDGFAVEIEERVVEANLDLLETLPAHYECYYRVVEAFKAIKGVSRVKLSDGELRVRCNKEVYDTLLSLKSARVGKGYINSKPRVYSNRLYFTPFDLYQEIDMLEKLAGLGTSATGIVISGVA